jgi:hypothetical protein
MTYSSKLRAVLREKGQPGFGAEKSKPPEWLLEKMYNEKLLGGFSKKRTCSTCNTCLPATGQCDYC